MGKTHSKAKKSSKSSKVLNGDQRMQSQKGLSKSLHETISNSQPATPKFKEKDFFTFSPTEFDDFEVLKAAYKNDYSCIVQYHSQGLDLDKPLNEAGWTLLHVAAQTGNIGLAKFLISNKVDINTVEYAENWTPLMVSVFNNQLEMTKFLISMRADVHLKDKQGKSAYDLAVFYNNPEIYKLII
jgi:ankyrin repeat protein